MRCCLPASGKLDAVMGNAETPRGDGPPLRPLSTRPMLRIDLDAADPVLVSDERRYVPLTGGRFQGRGGLEGVVLPGGADWQRVHPTGAVELEAHYARRTDDGRTIEVRSHGVRRASRDVLARLAAGEQVNPDEYYFRTHIRLESLDDSLAHLNHVLGLATGQRDRSKVHIHVHEVL